MKKFAIGILLISLLVAGYTADEDNKELNVQDEAVTTQIDEKNDILTLKSFEEYREYVDKNIKNYVELYDKYEIPYKLTTDKTTILAEMGHSKFGKEYKDWFLTSVKANVESGNSDVLNAIILTRHVNEEFLVDDKKIALVVDLLSIKDKSYKLKSFVEDLNREVEDLKLQEPMGNGHRRKVIRSDDDINIAIEIGYQSRLELHISTHTRGYVEYNKLKPMEFATYEDYKKLMLTTNYEIYQMNLSEDKSSVDESNNSSNIEENENVNEEQNINDSGMFDSLDSSTEEEVKDDVNASRMMEEPEELTTDNMRYKYGIFNARNLDVQTGDFKIELGFDLNPISTIDFVELNEPMEKMCTLLKNKFNINYEPKDIIDFFKSEREMKFFVFSIIQDGVIILDKEAMYGEYRNPFGGMSDILNLYHDQGNGLDTIKFKFIIPAIVEGETTR